MYALFLTNLSIITGHTFSSQERVSEKFETGTWLVRLSEDKVQAAAWSLRWFQSTTAALTNEHEFACAVARWRKCATTRWSEPEVCRGSRPTRTSLDSSEGSTLPSSYAAFVGKSVSTVCTPTSDLTVCVVSTSSSCCVSQRRGRAVPERPGEEKRRSPRSVRQRGAQGPGAAETQAPYGQQIHRGSLREEQLHGCAPLWSADTCCLSIGRSTKPQERTFSR